jgi:hypothetical protein
MFWNDDFSKKLENMSVDKSVYVIRTMAELNQFVDERRK